MHQNKTLTNGHGNSSFAQRFVENIVDLSFSHPTTNRDIPLQDMKAFAWIKNSGEQKDPLQQEKLTAVPRLNRIQSKRIALPPPPPIPPHPRRNQLEIVFA
jgi:hypothetical protein